MGLSNYANSFNLYMTDKIMKQGFIYSFNNVYSLSLLSGMGIGVEAPDGFFQKVQDKFLSDSLGSLSDVEPPHELFPLRAVYSKGNPRLLHSSEAQALEKNSMRWNTSSFKTTISPSTQAMLICAEVELAKQLIQYSLLEPLKESSLQEKYLALLFVHSAIEQGKFCDQNLRDHQGFFVEKKEKSVYRNHMALKQKKAEFELLDQIYMIGAFASLYAITHSSEPYFVDHEHSLYFYTLAIQLFEQLLSHEDSIMQLKTRYLVDAIPILASATELLYPKGAWESFITRLCAELNSRKLDAGRISNERFSVKPSSLATHFKAIKALSIGYRYTHYEHFLAQAKQIYHQLNQYWNSDLELFDFKAKKRLKYSSKDIGAILSGLSQLISLEKSPENKTTLTHQLCAFFNSSFNISGLQISNSTGADGDYLSERSLNLDPKFLTNGSHACVLLKEFNLYTRKNKLSVDIQEYKPLYALYAVNELLALVNTNLHTLPATENSEGRASLLIHLDEED